MIFVNNEELCDNSRLISFVGWIMFGAVFSFLLKYLIDGLLLTCENITSADGLKDLFTRIVVLCIKKNDKIIDAL